MRLKATTLKESTMSEFFWLLILVDGPLFLGLIIASLLLNRLPPIEAGAGMKRHQPSSSTFSINRNARRGMI